LLGKIEAGRHPKAIKTGDPNREIVIRLVGALMLEQNDEWGVSRRHLPVEKLAAMCKDIDAATMVAAQ